MVQQVRSLLLPSEAPFAIIKKTFFPLTVFIVRTNIYSGILFYGIILACTGFIVFYPLYFNGFRLITTYASRISKQVFTQIGGLRIDLRFPLFYYLIFSNQETGTIFSFFFKCNINA